MKSFMILGAVIGFLIGAGFSLVNNNPWPTTLWRAIAAALGLALLTRWWSRVWLHGLQEATRQHRRPHFVPTATNKSTTKV